MATIERVSQQEDAHESVATGEGNRVRLALVEERQSGGALHGRLWDVGQPELSETRALFESQTVAERREKARRSALVRDESEELDGRRRCDPKVREVLVRLARQRHDLEVRDRRHTAPNKNQVGMQGFTAEGERR